MGRMGGRGVAEPLKTQGICKEKIYRVWRKRLVSGGLGCQTQGYISGGDHRKVVLHAKGGGTIQTG